MALYTEKSYNELSNLFAREERARQNQLRQQQEQALQEYNNRKNSLDQKYENKGLGGFLGDIVGGIGKTIGDVGKGVGGLFGTAGASVADLVNSIKDGKVTNDSTNAFKRYWYDAENDKDAAAKAAGTSLNAATTLASTVLPGAGAGTAAGKIAAGTAANTAAGALSGIADEFQQQGQNASFEGAANRALSGAAAGLATGALNSKIGNATSNVGSKLLNNKFATSTLGRGALSGAVGGGVGAGTSAALAGQDVGQAALQGALTGAGAGATQAGIMSGINRLGQRVSNRNNTIRNVENTTPDTTDDFRAYGDSELANRTKKGMAADAISRLGNTLEGAQSNITRAAANDLGIDSTGKVIENVRKKTGLTNLETQAKLAKELTGGADSLLDNVQRAALTASEDGKPFKVDTTSVENNISKIVNQFADDNVLDTKKTAATLKRTVGNNDSDVISISNKLKSWARDLRGKGVAEPPAKDKALANIYSAVADELDDLSYSAIPKSNVNDMFDVAINEMKSRATQAQKNGNNDVVKAYTQLADALDNTERTIPAYRSFKKDFVEVSKISRLSNQAENGAAQNMGNSAAGAKKKLGNLLLSRPINAGLAKAGAGLNIVADKLGSSAGTGARRSVQTTPLSPEIQTILGNYIGRTTGVQQADNNIQNLRKEQEYQNLEDELSNATAGIDAMYGTGGNMGLDGSYGVSNSYNAQNSALNQLGSQLTNIANAMNNALAAGDMSAYTQLADLYKSAYNTYQMQADLSGLGSSSSNGTNTIKMSTTEKNQLAKLQTAGTAIDELETLFKKAGGGQGIIGGNIANFLGGLGLNSDVNTYNQLSQGLINQIGAAIGKTDALNTEGEVQRALSLVPKLTDDNQTAINKLATLRSLLKTNTGTYNDLYSA